MKFEEEKQDNPAILETGRVKTPNSRRKRVVKCQVYDELKRLFKIVDKIEEMWPAKGDDVAWLNVGDLIFLLTCGNLPVLWFCQTVLYFLVFRK